ncbi:hypothetical protein AOL_s00097g182 [Orbilia oligospora ATCC 24927]|uniref:BTB domain-containing protein n=1 Tax=Arthrobotrys oligospora (strain ATCC 24927 / CBS 115.81 / DSM 1491) TaxID=756982 RepID=G1XIK5_ARTOA|nr:hypothetical protein AOL_s00097g182 [Orbilia oligospora ATCC 24927]EGX47136.1 hypothetical protein AOL_s00097g182 [Orbilia oligospora ATCC 24927]
MSFKESPLYLYFEPDATLVVEEEEIKVHETVIVVYSGFFKAALNSGLKESHERRIEIHDIGLDTMTVVLNWLYRVPLTPLYDTDLKKEETVNDLFSNTTLKKIDNILQAFDFLQIKGAEVFYWRFMEDQCRKFKWGPPYFVPETCRNIPAALNSIYRYGYSLPEKYLDRVIREIKENGGNSFIGNLRGGLKKIEEPDPRFLRDLSVSLANVLANSR